jgi:Zn-finger nucleic acid-binding protein
MKCVKCDGTLRRVELEDVEVDQCDACSGIWFDSGELQRILGKASTDKLKTAATSSDTSDDTKRARCPRCRGEGKLVQVASLTSDIHVDTCAVCGGQWLDGGELDVLRGDGPLRSVGAFFRKLFG